MRSILVMADRKPGNDARIDAAIQIARRGQGHLTVLVDTPLSRYIAMDPMGGSYVVSEALDHARAQDDAAAAAIEQKLARGEVPFDVIRSEADPVTALAIAARLSDLAIVTRSGGLAGAPRFSPCPTPAALNNRRSGPALPGTAASRRLPRCARRCRCWPAARRSP